MVNSVGAIDHPDHSEPAAHSHSYEILSDWRRSDVLKGARAMSMQRLREQPTHCPNLSATVLKANGSSGPATITRLWYDGCEMASNERFEAGEQIKVIIRGMGGIDAHVTSATEGWLSARFVEECPV